MTNRLFSLNLEQIKNAIKLSDITVCVIGIGRIGLPTALSFANSGLYTIGLDINKELVDKINSREFPLKDEPGYDEIFDKVMRSQKLFATVNAEEAIPKADVVVLSLPTPMDQNNVPDYSALINVGNRLNKLLEPESIVIVESTIEPGFIENELVKIIEGESRRISAGKNIGIGVCPETANPGEILKDFENLPRLVGATDEKTANIIMELYKHVFPVELIKMVDCKTANAVKLTTNVFRDINIAFVNELAVLFEKIGIDTMKVLEAAKKKYNFQVHYPGAGVGGPCLPVNSYQMINSSNRFESDLKMVRAAREINEKMPQYVIKLTLDAFKEANNPINSSKILVLGISYKPNVKDIQLTPVKEIIETLKKLNAKVKIYDPYFKNEIIFETKVENDLIDALSDIDAVILATAHKEFIDLEPIFLASKMKTPIVIDARGIIDNHAAKKAGLIFRGLGRGRI